MTPRWRGLPWALAAALIAFGPPGRAQPASAPAPTLQRGLEAAWARQPEQRAAALRRDAAGAALQAAERWTPEPPALALTAKTDRFTGDNGGGEIEASLAVPLWWPGERSRTRAAASAEAEALETRLAATLWRLAAQVREAHWDHQRARLEKDLAGHRLAGARRLAADVERRLRAGDLARSDGHQAQAAVAAAEGALAEALAASSRAAGRWAQLTGAAPADIDDAAPEPPPRSPAPADSHPLLRELQTRAELARRQRDLAGTQEGAHPELTLGAVHERGVFGEADSQRLIVGLRLPIGRQAAGAARLAAANAEQLEAEALAELEQQKLQLDIEAAKAHVDALAAAAAAAQRRADLAGESRGFFDKSFRLGETDLPTRLRIELEAFEAERQAARSRIEHAAAVSQWRQALGLLPE